MPVLDYSGSSVSSATIDHVVRVDGVTRRDVRFERLVDASGATAPGQAFVFVPAALFGSGALRIGAEVEIFLHVNLYGFSRRAFVGLVVGETDKHSVPGATTYEVADGRAELARWTVERDFNVPDPTSLYARERLSFAAIATQIVSDWKTAASPSIEVDVDTSGMSTAFAGEQRLEGMPCGEALDYLLTQGSGAGGARWRARYVGDDLRLETFSRGVGRRRSIRLASDATATMADQAVNVTDVDAVDSETGQANRIVMKGARRVAQATLALTPEWPSEIVDPSWRTITDDEVMRNWRRFALKTMAENRSNPYYYPEAAPVGRVFTIAAVSLWNYASGAYSDHHPEILSRLVNGGERPFLVYRLAGETRMRTRKTGWRIDRNRRVVFDEPFLHVHRASTSTVSESDIAFEAVMEDDGTTPSVYWFLAGDYAANALTGSDVSFEKLGTQLKSTWTLAHVAVEGRPGAWVLQVAQDGSMDAADVAEMAAGGVLAVPGCDGAMIDVALADAVEDGDTLVLYPADQDALLSAVPVWGTSLPYPSAYSIRVYTEEWQAFGASSIVSNFEGGALGGAAAGPSFAGDFTLVELASVPRGVDDSLATYWPMDAAVFRATLEKTTITAETLEAPAEVLLVCAYRDTVRPESDTGAVSDGRREFTRTVIRDQYAYEVVKAGCYLLDDGGALGGPTGAEHVVRDASGEMALAAADLARQGALGRQAVQVRAPEAFLRYRVGDTVTANTNGIDGLVIERLEIDRAMSQTLLLAE